VNTVSFDRLSLPFSGKDAGGKRIYEHKTVSDEDMTRIFACVSSAVFPRYS
jgi:hypothetical protein